MREVLDKAVSRFRDKFQHLHIRGPGPGGICGAGHLSEPRLPWIRPAHLPTVGSIPVHGGETETQ